ncbi:MAG: hypothetical protein KA201_26820, partial [Kofleriaceae bacterium]|nr:hypothetical protein [Kofleriaceae bacterium]
AQTIRGAAPAPARAAGLVASGAVGAVQAPASAPVSGAAARPRRWPWLIAGAVAVVIGVGVIAARPWARGPRAAAAPSAERAVEHAVVPTVPAAVAPSAPAAAAPAPPLSPSAPTTGETRPAHVRPSTPAPRSEAP